MHQVGTQFAVRGVHQIEMTSLCNLRCKYCAYPKMTRAKEHMSDDVYRQSLRLTRHFIAGSVAFNGRRELNLAGIGESTMHPEFVRNVHWAREAVGPDVSLILATNGLLVTAELARAIAPAAPRVWVSLHRPEKAGPAIEALKGAGILAGVSADSSVNAVNWAGQVDWHVSTTAKGTACPWVQPGLIFVLSDGRTARCCFDAKADDVLGTVFDDPESMKTSAFKLCGTCHHDVGVALQ